MAGGQKQSNRPNRDLIKKDSGQAEKHLKISKYNAKLIKYSPSTTKSALWGAEAAPLEGFGRILPVGRLRRLRGRICGGTVLDQFGIAFANLSLFFGLAMIF